MHFIKLICLMGIILHLHAAQPAYRISFSPNSAALHQQLKKTSDQDCKESIVKSGRQAFGEKIEAESQNRILKATAEIESLSDGEDRAFWMKILNAYETLDIRAIERLQNERQSALIEEQILIIDFICGVQSALDKQKSEVVISSMTDIKKGSFF